MQDDLNCSLEAGAKAIYAYMRGLVIGYFVPIDYRRRLSSYLWLSCGSNRPTMPLEPIRCVLGSLADRRDAPRITDKLLNSFPFEIFTPAAGCPHADQLPPANCFRRGEDHS